MNPEEKQKYIEAISTKMRSIAEECDENLQFEYDVLKLALAALTAQPVKLEPIIQIGYTQDEITCMCNIRNDDIKAIRAAGYEVQE